MKKRELCSQCAMGKHTYELDKRSSECPYIYCHNGRKCSMYKKIKRKKKAGILKDFVNWVFYPPPRKNEHLTAF